MISSELRALVANSLYIDYPNPDLDRYLVRILERAGYRVDLVLGEAVDLDLYSRLTQYSLIILRVHGGKATYRLPAGEVRRINGLFTGLLRRSDYEYLKRRWIATRAFPYGSKKAYLAVLPKFFEERLRGRFKPGTIMVVTSCYPLYTLDISNILAKKGLSMYIGWRGPVSAVHMDRALLNLVRYVVENLTWTEDVGKVNDILEPDPSTKEHLYIVIYGTSSYKLSQELYRWSQEHIDACEYQHDLVGKTMRLVYWYYLSVVRYWF